MSNSIRATLAVLIATAPLTWGTTVLISIDQTGANDPVWSGAPRTWNFEIKQQIVVSKSLFALKDGNNTVEDITFSLWDDLGGTGSALRTVALTPGDVDGQFNTSEVFEFLDITLDPGFYSATLTSPAASSNTGYFMKLGKMSLFLDDGSGNQADPSLWTQDGNNNGTATASFTTASAVPEPGNMIALCGLIGSGVFLRSRRAAGRVSQS